MRIAEERHRAAGGRIVDPGVPDLRRATDVDRRRLAFHALAETGGAEEVGLQLHGRERALARLVERNAHRAEVVGEPDDHLREQEARARDQLLADDEVAVDAVRIAPVEDEAEAAGETVGEEGVQRLRGVGLVVRDRGTLSGRGRRADGPQAVPLRFVEPVGDVHAGQVLPQLVGAGRAEEHGCDPRVVERERDGERG